MHLVDIAKCYYQIPSEELWTTRTIDNTIFQIIFLKDSGKLSETNLMNILIEELNELIEIIFQFAESESKNNKDKNFTMHRSDISIGNNQILVSSDKFETGYVSLNIFNQIQVNNQLYLKEIHSWMTYMFKSGLKISGSGAPSRMDLYNIYKTKINLLEDYLLKKDYNAKMKLLGV